MSNLNGRDELDLDDRHRGAGADRYGGRLGHHESAFVGAQLSRNDTVRRVSLRRNGLDDEGMVRSGYLVISLSHVVRFGNLNHKRGCRCGIKFK